MKKTYIALTLTALILLTGCVQNHAINTNLINPKPNKNHKMTYENNKFKPIWTTSTTITSLKTIRIKFENKSDETIKLNWNEAAFVAPDKSVTGIVHGNVQYENLNSSIPPTIIPEEAIKKFGIYSSENAVQGPLGIASILFSTNNQKVEKYNNKKISLLLPIKIDEKYKEYEFNFKLNIESKSENK